MHPQTREPVSLDRLDSKSLSEYCTCVCETANIMRTLCWGAQAEKIQRSNINPAEKAIHQFVLPKKLIGFLQNTRVFSMKKHPLK